MGPRRGCDYQLGPAIVVWHDHDLLRSGLGDAGLELERVASRAALPSKNRSESSNPENTNMTNRLSCMCAVACVALSPACSEHSDGGEAGDGNASPASLWARCDHAPTADCTPAALCEEIAHAFPPCRASGSPLDEDGCFRQSCHNDADCDEGERCLASPLVVADSCMPPGIDLCYASSAGTCACDVLSECDYYSVCTPESVAPRSEDCPVESVDCPDEGWERALDSALGSIGSGLRADVEACLARVQEARAECDPE